MKKMLTWKLLAIGLLFCIPIVAEEYNPLAVTASREGQTAEFVVKDESRQRAIPVKIYLPVAADSSPVILFSHGLGGTREGCVYLGKHWSARGYVVVFLQHAGSDDSVWKDAPLRKRMLAMQEAASSQNFLLRVRDVPVVLDQLEGWNRDGRHVLAGQLDMRRVGMSGHSFGAVTTQAVSGQSIPLGGTRFTDARIKAAIAFSPSSPRRGDPNQAFGSVKIPWLLMTGTKDTSPIGGQTVESRMAVYPRLPDGIDKYELVLHNAEHSAFTDRALPGDRELRNPNHHRAILALTTAFWDAHLKNDDSARAWLHGAEARSVLESEDRWQLHRNEKGKQAIEK
jgi:predicted dienelactone hydrolase